MANVEAVLKVGGSLAEDDALVPLCRMIGELATLHRLLVVPGGGPFADTARHFYRRWRLSETAAHSMAILGMDQYGHLLCDLIPGAVPVFSLISVEHMLRERRVPVLIPSQLMAHADALPHSWMVTSDSIAAWVATLVGPAQLILLKDVDGLCTPEPRLTGGSRLVAEVTADHLAGYGVVDDYLGELLAANQVDAWIVNGGQPERLAELLARGWTQGTHVLAE